MDKDKKEVLISTAKSLFGAVPYIGTALNEALFGYRSSIKLRRLELFVGQVGDAMKLLKEETIDKDYLSSEDFVDFFEALLLRVVRTRSDEKIRRFKTVFIRQIQQPSPSDFMETFLDITASLHEAQILILETHRNFRGVKNQNEYLARLGRSANAIPDVLAPPEFRTAAYYGLSEGTYKFYVQDLISRSLLLNEGIGRYGGGGLLQNLEVTELGIQFLEFIKEFPA